MKIIKESKLKESMSPNERVFYLLGKGEANKATDMVDKKAIFALRKLYPDLEDEEIEETDEFGDLVTKYEGAYIKGISEMLHNPIDGYA